MEWCNLLVPESRAYIWEASFKPIIGLLSEKSASATLVQCPIERWWDTTHICHIAERELTVTPYDFYRMTGLSFKGAIISLEGVSVSSWVLTCWGGSTPLRPFATSTWCRITCFSHRGLQRSVSIWLGPSFYICWELTSSPMVGKWYPWGVWPFFKTLKRHRGPTGGGMSHLSLLHTRHS